MLSTCKYKAIGLLDVDEKLQTVIIHMRSNDITKINYENVSAEDLAQEIINIAKKYRLFGVNENAISSILLRKNVKFNKIIKKVTELISMNL